MEQHIPRPLSTQLQPLVGISINDYECVLLHRFVFWIEPDSGSIEAAPEALRLKLSVSDKEPDVLSNADSDEAEIGVEEVELEQKITYAGQDAAISNK